MIPFKEYFLIEAEIKELDNRSIREVSRDMESIETKHFPRGYAQPSDDIIDDSQQPGFFGYGIFDNNQIKGYSYAWDLSEDEMEEIDDLDYDDVTIHDQHNAEYLQNPRKYFTSRNTLYVPNMVVEPRYRMYVKSLIQNLLSQARQRGKRFIVFDALTATGKLFVNPDGSVKEDRLNAAGLRPVFSVPGYQSSAWIMELV